VTWADDLARFAADRLSERERKALLTRGVSDAQIETYQIGHLNRVLPGGLPSHFLEWSKFGDKLDDVFVFPLTTTLGEVRGFEFRHVVKERTGYTDFLLDRREPCLFGLAQAIEAMWESRSVWLVEGPFDLPPIQRAAPFVVSTMTAFTNKATVRLLRRLVQRVWVGYDMDGPGRKGCEIFRSKNKRDFEVYIVEYPKVLKANGERVKDPGELWEEWGDRQIIPFIRSAIERENPF